MEINNVTFAYPDKITRLHDVSGKITKGEITTIIGPNGCGKSTLMGVLTNNHIPQNGEIILSGMDLKTYKAKELAKVLGVVYQQNIAPEDLTVERLVHYGRLPYKGTFSQSTRQDDEKVDWALACTGLSEKRHLTIDTLSGGQQQRVWIALALAQDTPYLLLDEPTSNLDIYFQYEILELVKTLRDQHGLTIVMILHDINQAIQYSDTIIAMKNGAVLATGNPADIMTAQLIQDVFGIHVVVKEDEMIGKYIVPVGI